MSGHPCGECLRWPECNGVAWGTNDCPYACTILITGGPVREAMERAAEIPEPEPLPRWPKNNPFIPAYLDDRTESGLLEE